MEETPCHQLIVLGNGFDLECGLPSRFSDFFAPRRALLDVDDEAVHAAGEKSWGTYLAARGITAWDIALAKAEDALWCDIEGAISYWVQPPKTGDAPMERIARHLASTTLLTRVPLLRESVASDLAKKLNSHGADTVDLPAEQAIAIFLAQTRRAQIAEVLSGKRSIASVLLDELHRFEQEFARYLGRMVDADPAYRSRAATLLRQIAGFGADALGARCALSVLNFNYTRPVGEAGAPVPADEMVNVHGRIDRGDIVFGIDGKEYMESEQTLPFTKTYRLLALNSITSTGLIRTPHDGARATDLITFYGHSLNAADYSYFQALFDGVNLYGGNTRLLFLFRPWRDGQGRRVVSDVAREDLFHKVTHLLAEYGSTMDNVDHGKNLIHKLLLEGRLSVEELPESGAPGSSGASVKGSGHE